MKTLWGKFLCGVWFKKHKRGKRITTLVSDGRGGTRPLSNLEEFRCSRCDATWTRKVRPKPAKPVLPTKLGG